MIATRRSIRWVGGLIASLVVLAGAGAIAVGSWSCAPSPDNHKNTDILMPDFPTYAANVDAFVARRCGTLDCHGQPGRAYRLYGFTGFRLLEPDGGGTLVSGQQPTTPDEIRANYQAAVSLEPEEMTRLMATQGAEPNNLLLLRKPLKLERHKGGPAMATDDSGYKCVVAWLRIRVVRPTQDGTDFETIPEGDREKFSARAAQDCLDAQSNP
jgi:hypothetical protein